MAKSVWQQKLYPLCATIISLAIIYITGLNMHVFGTTWLFWFPILPLASFGAIAPRIRSNQKALITICFLLGGIRLLSICVDSGRFMQLSLPGLWFLALGLVFVTVHTTAATLDIPLWPKTDQEDRSKFGREALWVTVVFRPLIMFFLPLVLSISVLAYRWSNRFGPSHGVAISSTVGIACLISIGSRFVTVFSLKKRNDALKSISNIPTRPATRKVAIVFSVVYLLGLGVEWRTTENYLLWSILSILGMASVLLSGLLSHLELGAEDVLSTRSDTWSQSKTILYALLIVSFSLMYIELTAWVLR